MAYINSYGRHLRRHVGRGEVRDLHRLLLRHVARGVHDPLLVDGWAARQRNHPVFFYKKNVGADVLYLAGILTIN